MDDDDRIDVLPKKKACGTVLCVHIVYVLVIFALCLFPGPP